MNSERIIKAAEKFLDSGAVILLSKDRLWATHERAMELFQCELEDFKLEYQQLKREG